MLFRDLWEAKWRTGRGSEPRAPGDGYNFTYDPRDPDGALSWEQFRNRIKDNNKNAKTDKEKLRITRMGRLGDDNPHAEKYRRGGKLSASATIKTEYSQRFDVYSRPRFGSWELGPDGNRRK